MSSEPYLPAEVSVVHVTHKQRLGGESVRLDVHVRSGHLKTHYIDYVSVFTPSPSTRTRNRCVHLNKVQEKPNYPEIHSMITEKNFTLLMKLDLPTFG